MARKKKTNEDQSENNDNINESDDTFGLPEIEYEPLKREETIEEVKTETIHTTIETPVAEHTVVEETQYVQPAVEQPTFQQEDNQYVPSYEDEEEKSSSWPAILGILAIIVVLGGVAWYWFGVYKPQQDAELKAKQEMEAREAAEKRKAADAALAEKRKADEQRRADSLAALKPAVGTIETLSARTGRYYVIVASGVDGDLIMDYAKKLSPQGISTKIIPPSGKVKFYRLAVADGDTYASTQTTADELKSNYEGGAWVIKF